MMRQVVTRSATRPRVGRRIRTLVAVACLGLPVAAVSVSSTAGAAIAPTDGENSGGGYTATVRLTGEAVPGSGSEGGTSYVKVTVSPICWWQPARGPYTDMAASLAWYEGVTGGAQTRGTIGEYGPRRIWEAARDAEASGAKLAWYRAFCTDPERYLDYHAGSQEEVDGIDGIDENYVTYYYRTFDQGVPVPDPLVGSAELARVARENMELLDPEVERNPKVRAAGGEATLVGLPTWFWVRNPIALGGEDGERDITASLGDVSATVWASTDWLHLTSAGGSKDCTRARGLVGYNGAAAEASACTVEFARASAGYDVTSTTNWNARWEGSDGDSGTLAPLTRTATVTVPVAEVQNIVTR